MKKNLTILIVDDNPENLGVLGSIIDESGYTPCFSTNGVEALRYVKEKHPSLILLDIMMPDMNGFEVCRLIKQDPTLADIPIIFLTAKTEKDDVIAGLELGAVDYVTKPFSQKELLTRINTHLELQATKEKLRESLATKDKLFSIIGHDLSNIFFGLQGYAELLKTDEEMQSDIETKKRDIQKLIQVANEGYDLLMNLLNWSKSQTGKLRANPTTLVLKDAVYRNIELQHDQANSKNITISGVIDNNILIFVDANMFDTILRNLISNALKFTQEYGKIQITAEQVEDNLIEIVVSDTGIGIKDIDKLFRIDIKARTHGTAGEKGNGLGLVLCKELIEKCDGTIEVNSEVGKGSKFFVRLPAKDKLNGT